MKYFIWLFSITAGLYSCNSGNPAPAKTVAATKDNLPASIDSLVQLKQPRSFNGVILITQNGETKYAKAYGFSNAATQSPLQMGDQFEIMSNSKQFTAVLLLKEVEKGTVSLQAPIRKYLPELKQSWADTVTVHQLLNHTHGIIDINKPLQFAPGTDFQYGNLACSLLGKIIENASSKSYAELATALFKELKMEHTYCYPGHARENLVSGHRNKDNVLSVEKESFIDAYNLPADGIVTTAGDLAIWNNNLHKGKILKPESYKLMTTASVQAQHDVFGKEKVGYGYNIRIASQNGIPYYGHTGLGDGFASMNIYIPGSDISLIVLENQMSEDNTLSYYFEIQVKNLLFNSNLVKNTNAQKPK